MTPTESCGTGTVGKNCTISSHQCIRKALGYRHHLRVVIGKLLSRVTPRREHVLAVGVQRDVYLDSALWDGVVNVTGQLTDLRIGLCIGTAIEFGTGIRRGANHCSYGRENMKRRLAKGGQNSLRYLGV